MLFEMHSVNTNYFPLFFLHLYFQFRSNHFTVNVLPLQPHYEQHEDTAWCIHCYISYYLIHALNEYFLSDYCVPDTRRKFKTRTKFSEFWPGLLGSIVTLERYRGYSFLFIYYFTKVGYSLLTKTNKQRKNFNWGQSISKKVMEVF